MICEHIRRSDVALFGGRTTSSEDPELRFLSAQLPMFPPIAQTAHVTGLVNASFLVDESGNVISATILSGPKILADETEKNIRTWKFASLPSRGAGPLEGPYDVRLRVWQRSVGDVDYQNAHLSAH